MCCRRPQTGRVLASLYKARGPSTKSEVCAICVERSRGRTVRVHLGRGVSVWLCAGHASDDFRRRRGGRDFVLTLHRLWSAHGCLTKPRSRALDDHLAAMRSEPPAPRHRPGSYSWAALRRDAEQRFRAGEEPARVIRDLRRPALRRRGHGAERADDAPLVSGAAMAAAGAGRRDQRAGCANWPSERRPIRQTPHQPLPSHRSPHRRARRRKPSRSQRRTPRPRPPQPAKPGTTGRRFT